MGEVVRYWRTMVVISLFVALIIAFTKCTNGTRADDRAGRGARFSDFAGSAACQKCHQSIYDEHLASFHHLTSAEASLSSIKGSFEDGKNSFFFNPLLYIKNEKTDSGLFQSAYRSGIREVSRPFSFAIGSGKRGQTYLYWYKNYLFQLPISYFTATNEWTNSPGYSNKIEFNRPITSRCLECHSTYFEAMDQTADAKTEMFSKEHIIVGVECEKCHGPGAEHIAFHLKHPADTVARYIVNTARLTRDRDLDLCRSCHGGRLNKKMPSFSFRPGSKLGDYFKIDSALPNGNEIDVHGNQFGMMAASRCFTSSNMTCLSCHDSHKKEVAATATFASRCLNCHNGLAHQTCKLAPSMPNDVLINNCVDCHMPELPSKAIMVLRQGESVPTPAQMRSHLIRTYPEISESILEKNKVATQTTKGLPPQHKSL